MKHRIYSPITLILVSLISLSHYMLCIEELDQEYLHLADTLKDEGFPEKAIAYYTKALELQPHNLQALFNCANCLYNQNNLELAIGCYKKFLSIKSDCAPVYFNVGICYMRLNDHQNALDAFEKTTHYNPQHFNAHQQLSQLYVKQNNFKKALIHAQKVVDHQPRDFDAQLRLGQIYKELDSYETALYHLHTAVNINPTHIPALLELANILNMCDNTEQALVYYHQILALNPSVNEVLYNIGFTYKKQGNFDKAIDMYTKIIAQDSGYAQPHFSLALCYLTLGNFEQGWREYEWRWSAYNEKARIYSAPEWKGENITGKTILLYAEQGLGDTFQFIRYAQELKKMGATVIVDTQTPLKNVLRLVPYLDKVIDSHDCMPPFDYHKALMSLPLVFKTTLKTVPAHIPYLYADQILEEQWRSKLAGDTNFKIGLCWQGNAQYSTQFLRKAVAAKSFNIKKFEPLAQLEHVSLYSIQKINGVDQLAELDSTVKVHIFDESFDREHGRFMDTAAVIKNMDLIITIDTSIGHFAAALGAPTWILLPEPADWRWMLSRTDTPWYPNVRLFRQPKKGDWQGTIAQVVHALQELLHEKKAHPHA